MTSLANDLAEGQDYEDAARSTAAEQSSSELMLAIYDCERPSAGREREGRRPRDRAAAAGGDTERRGSAANRARVRRRRPAPAGVSECRHPSIPSTSSWPAPTWNQWTKSSTRSAAYSGTSCRWRCALPASADRSSRATACRRSSRWPTGAQNRGREPERAPAGRQFARRAGPPGRNIQRAAGAAGGVADPATAVHGRRVARAADACCDNSERRQAWHCSIEHRDELEYRDTLAIVEQQAPGCPAWWTTCSRWRVPTPATSRCALTPMYLDEVIDDVVRAARVIASTKSVSIDPMTIPSAAFTGDEDLIRRMIGNLIDNAVRHAPSATTVLVDLDKTENGYAIAVRTSYWDPARIRELTSSSAFTGRALGPAPWHDVPAWASPCRVIATPRGDLVLARSSPSSSTFVASLPSRG